MLKVKIVEPMVFNIVTTWIFVKQFTHETEAWCPGKRKICSIYIQYTLTLNKQDPHANVSCIMYLHIYLRGCSQMTSAIFGVSDTRWCLCQPIISLWPTPWCFCTCTQKMIIENAKSTIHLP